MSPPAISTVFPIYIIMYWISIGSISNIKSPILTRLIKYTPSAFYTKFIALTLSSMFLYVYKYHLCLHTTQSLYEVSSDRDMYSRVKYYKKIEENRTWESKPLELSLYLLPKICSMRCEDISNWVQYNLDMSRLSWLYCIEAVFASRLYCIEAVLRETEKWRVRKSEQKIGERIILPFPRHLVFKFGCRDRGNARIHQGDPPRVIRL